MIVDSLVVKLDTFDSVTLLPTNVIDRSQNQVYVIMTSSRRVHRPSRVGVCLCKLKLI